MNHHKPDNAHHPGADRAHGRVREIGGQIEEHHAADEQNIRQRRRERAPHDVFEEFALHERAVRLHCEEKRRNSDRHAVHKAELRGAERIRQSEDQADDRHCNGEDVLHKVERGRALDVVDDAPPLGDNVRERGEVRVGQNDLRYLTGNVASRGHGDGAVGLLEREHVVHAVAGHGDGVALLFEREDKPALHLRRHAAEYNAFARRLFDLLVGFERAGVHRPIRVRDARAAGDLGNGERVVAGDHAHRNPLARKPRERLRRLGADPVGEQYKRYRQALGGEPLVRELPVIERKEQHAAALRAVIIDFFLIGVIIAAENDLRRAEKVGLVLMERNAAVFPRACERERRNRALVHLTGEEFPQRRHGVVVAAHRRAVVRHDHVDVRGDEPVGAERDDIVHDHFVFRHRAGLVHAERIDARERFDAVHLAAHGLFLRQTQHARHEREAREQIHPLRDHADERAYRGRDARGDAPAEPVDLLHNEQHAHRNDADADPFDKVVQRFHHTPGLTLFLRLRVERQTADERIGAHGGEPCAAHAGDKKAAGEQRVARRLAYLVRLAGDERLIHKTRAVYHDGVGAHLPAGREDHDIVAHEFGDLYAPFLPLAHDGALRRGQNMQRIERLFAAQLLHDANDGIDNDDNDERKVQYRGLHRHKTQRKHKKDKVKIGEKILPHDLPRGARGRLDGKVRPPRGGARGSLGLGESLKGRRLLHGNLPPDGFLFFFSAEQLQSSESFQKYNIC